MVVVAYGLILPQQVLDIPRLGCINVHASILPRWRGAAPIQRAIEAGDASTGVTIMEMEAGLDTGPMLVKVSCPIDAEETSASLHDKLAQLGGPALVNALDLIADGAAKAEKQQDSDATYAAKILKPEAAIDWHQPATVLARKIRAFNPFPICFSSLQHDQGNENLRLWQAKSIGPTDPDSISNQEQRINPESALNPQTIIPGTIVKTDDTGLFVACGEGMLQITEIQFPGKKALAGCRSPKRHWS